MPRIRHEGKNRRPVAILVKTNGANAATVGMALTQDTQAGSRLVSERRQMFADMYAKADEIPKAVATQPNSCRITRSEADESAGLVWFTTGSLEGLTQRSARSVFRFDSRKWLRGVI